MAAKDNKDDDKSMYCEAYDYQDIINIAKINQEQQKSSGCIGMLVKGLLIFAVICFLLNACTTHKNTDYSYTSSTHRASHYYSTATTNYQSQKPAVTTTHKSYNPSYKSTTTTKKYDPYNIGDYDDPEDLYYDNEDDFDGYDDAEDYWDEYYE